MSTETPDLPFDLPPESTPSDGASISDPFPPRVVRASAGSGKTFDLVGRYLGLLAAGVEPESISYIEAHGTGTPLGDPVEIEGLKQAFDSSQKNYCGLVLVSTK